MAHDQQEKQEQLAKTFAEVLKEYLTDDEWSQMLERNQTTAEDICASHDFCDANDAMSEAFSRLKIPMWKEVDADGEPTNAAMEAGMLPEAGELWNAAWKIAKQDYLTGEPEKKSNAKSLRPKK